MTWGDVRSRPTNAVIRFQVSGKTAKLGDWKMAEIRVTNQASFLAAIKVAKGGDTILLADGDYGSILLKSKYGSNLPLYSSDVTIKSENPYGANFAGIEIQYGQNLRFDGINIENTFKVGYSSKNIDFINGKAGTLNFRNVDGTEITGSETSGGRYGLILWDSTNFLVENNNFHSAYEDVARVIGNSYNGVIQSNIFYDTTGPKPLHCDLMMVYGYQGKAPHDLLIAGNLFAEDKSTGSQVVNSGLFIANTGGDPEGFRNITVQENVFSISHINALYTSSGQENINVLNNTLSNGVIRLAAGGNGLDNAGVTVEGNIARKIVVETPKSEVSENLILGNDADGSALFLGGASGKTWADFLPVEGSLTEAYGASTWLKVFLGISESAEESKPEFIKPVSVFHFGSAHFSGNSSSIKTFANTDALKLDEATVDISFNLDVTGWRRGIFSKNSAGIDNGLTAYVDQGTLKIVFEDEQGKDVVSVSGMQAKKDYDLVISFGHGKGQVWLDGVLKGEVESNIDWGNNDEAVLVGGDNALSASGSTSAMRYAYDGTIASVDIYNAAMSYDELTLLQNKDYGLLY